MTDDMERDTSGGPLGGDQDEDAAGDRGRLGERVDEFLHGKDEPGIGGGGDWDLGGSESVGDTSGATGDLDMGIDRS